MAATYVTDLTASNTITDCESTASPALTEFTGWAEGTPDSDSDTDFFIQGSGCHTAECKGKTGAQSIVYNYGSDLIGSFSSGTCVFVWQHMFGNAINTFALGGYRVGVGNSAAKFSGWKTGGNDFGRNPYGGWQNSVVDPTYTADYSGSSGASAYQFFGAGFNMTVAISKGQPEAMDVIRWGRGTITCTTPTSGTCTFSGAATQNDSQANRWGLLQAEGTGFLWKGQFAIGDASTACTFTDSNVNITVDDTPRTYAAFNSMEINNASTSVTWTGINITALNAAQLSPGNFVMNADASVTMTDCVFTDMNTFVLDSNATLDGCTFRRCAQITQAGADIDDCTFDSSDSAVSVLCDNINNIDNCAFVSDGSNHGLELTSAHSASITYTLTGCSWSSYAASDGSTANECIYNNSGKSLTINVGTAQTPTIRNGSSASTTINASVPVNITVKDTDGSGVATCQVGCFKISDRTEIFTTTDTDASGAVSESFSGSTPVAVEVRCRKASSGATKYKNYSSLQTIESSTGLTMTVTLDEDPNNNATS